MLWMVVVACGGQAHECEKANKYLGWMDEDGTTAAGRDLEASGTSDCTYDDERDECARWVEAHETLETCLAECEWNESHAYTECNDGCREEASVDAVHFDSDGYQWCIQECDDQPTWECE